MKRWFLMGIMLFSMLLISNLGNAGIFKLKNGQRLEGQIKTETSTYYDVIPIIDHTRMNGWIRINKAEILIYTKQPVVYQFLKQPQVDLIAVKNAVRQRVNQYNTAVQREIDRDALYQHEVELAEKGLKISIKER